METTSEPEIAPPSHGRVLAFDRLRGLVMVLMTLDHATYVFSSEHFGADSAYFGKTGADLVATGSAWPFITRWLTHLCAPVFLFLVGVSMAQSVEARRARGQGELAIDRHLALRGLMLIALEAWMSIGFGLLAFQVLWAIGASILCFVLLRRLPSLVVGGLGAAWILGGEAVTHAMGFVPDTSGLGASTAGWPEALAVAPRFFPYATGFDAGGVTIPGFVVVNYPFVGWLAIACLGWAFGAWYRQLPNAHEAARRGAKVALVGGAVLLALFLAQRAANGYGNFGLDRTDESLLRWLQVSKYPPSIAFIGLELGLGLVALSLLLRFEARGRHGPLVVFGQSSLFYYLVHVHLMALACGAIGIFDPEFRWTNWYTPPPQPIVVGWIGAAATLAVMYPVCWWRRRAREHT